MCSAAAPGCVFTCSAAAPGCVFIPFPLPVDQCPSNVSSNPAS